MIKVDFGGVVATINNYRWVSDNKSLSILLNNMLPEGGCSGSDPFPDKTAAEDAIKKLGGSGRIIEIIGYIKDNVSNRVY